MIYFHILRYLKGGHPPHECGGFQSSKDYKGTHANYKCICRFNHEPFYLYWKDAKSKNRWCPYCAKVKVDPGNEMKLIHEFCNYMEGECLEDVFKDP